MSNLDDDVQEGVNKVSITNKNEAEEDKDTNSDWNLPKRENDFVIIAFIENNFSKAQTIKMRVICEDEQSKKNIKAPVNEIEATIKPLTNDMWMILHKVDPDQDWGKFRFEWSSEDRKIEGYSRTNLTFSDQGYGDGYSSVMAGPSIHMNYYGIG